MYKPEIWLIHNGRKRLQIARIGERIKTDKRVFRIGIHHKVAEIPSDKAGAAGHKILTHEFSPIFKIFSFVGWYNTTPPSYHGSLYFRKKPFQSIFPFGKKRKSIL